MERPFRPGETHQAEKGVRGDREEAGFHKGYGEEPAFGMGVGGFGQRPLVKLCEHRRRA